MGRGGGWKECRANSRGPCGWTWRSSIATITPQTHIMYCMSSRNPSFSSCLKICMFAACCRHIHIYHKCMHTSNKEAHAFSSYPNPSRRTVSIRYHYKNIFEHLSIFIFWLNMFCGGTGNPYVFGREPRAKSTWVYFIYVSLCICSRTLTIYNGIDSPHTIEPQIHPIHENVEVVQPPFYPQSLSQHSKISFSLRATIIHQRMCPDHSKCTQAHPSYTVEDSYANSTHKLLFSARGKRWIWPLCFLLGERKRKKVQKPSFDRPLLFLLLFLLVFGYVPYDVGISSTCTESGEVPSIK